MKAFPEAVQKAFPCAPGRVPDRPWWRYGVVPCRRRLIPELDTEANEQYLAKNDEEAAKADARHPISHPGYRAGQVWVAENGWGIVITSNLDNSTIWTTIGTGWSPEEFKRAYPYLVADPACPHLAPWSPMEEK